MDSVYSKLTILVIIPYVIGTTYRSTNMVVDVREKNATFTWLSQKSSNIDVNIIDWKNNSLLEQGKSYDDPVYKTVLPRCRQYKVNLKHVYSDMSTETMTDTFWMTDNIFYTELGNDVNLTVTSTFCNECKFLSPSGKQIDHVILSESAKQDNRRVDQQTAQISLTNINTTDGGMYELIDESISQVLDCFLLIVLDVSQPGLSYSPENAFVNDSIQLNCSSKVQYFPTEISKNINYTYFINDAEINGTTVIMGHRDKGKNISCKATDVDGTVSKTSKSVPLDPYYGPINVVVDPADTVVNIKEGKRLPPIKCSADCYPNCNYVWKYGENVVARSQEFDIKNVTRKMSGKYKCRIKHSNDVKRKETAIVDINVQYPTSFENCCRLTSGLTDIMTTDDVYSFTEGENVTIDMTVSGNPEPTIILYSNNTVIPHKSEQDNQTYYRLTVNNLTCEDTGLFTLEAENGITPKATKTLEITVHCRPKFVTQPIYDVVTELEVLQPITFTVSSSPEPNVTWMNETGTTWEIHKHNDYQYTLTSWLKASNRGSLGVYVIQICNMVGCEVTKVRLRKERKLEIKEIVLFALPVLVSIILSLLLIISVKHGRRQHQEKEKCQKEPAKLTNESQNQSREKISTDAIVDLTGDTTAEEKITNIAVSQLSSEVEKAEQSITEKDESNREGTELNVKSGSDAEGKATERLPGLVNNNERSSNKCITDVSNSEGKSLIQDINQAVLGLSQDNVSAKENGLAVSPELHEHESLHEVITPDRSSEPVSDHPVKEANADTNSSVSTDYPSSWTDSDHPILDQTVPIKSSELRRDFSKDAIILTKPSALGTDCTQKELEITNEQGLGNDCATPELMTPTVSIGINVGGDNLAQEFNVPTMSYEQKIEDPSRQPIDPSTLGETPLFEGFGEMMFVDRDMTELDKIDSDFPDIPPVLDESYFPTTSPTDDAMHKTTE